MFGIVVGSNTATSRQLRIFFPVEDTDNIMEGFALFEKGFTLEDSITTCSFDAFFPVSGDVILSGGTLTLLRDIELKKPFSIGPGTIDANGYAIEFPGNFSSIDIPTKYHTDLFLDIETKDAVTEIESVHWSYDDKYRVVGSRIADGHEELHNLKEDVGRRRTGRETYHLQEERGGCNRVFPRTTSGDEGARLRRQPRYRSR